MNPTARYAPRQIDWITRCDLTPVARLVADIIDRAPRNAPAAWFGAQRIADSIGRCKRSVQAALRELELKGLIEIVKDYSIRTRRRLVLLWRKPAEPETPTQEPEPTEGAMNHVPADLRPVVATPRHAAPQAAAAPRVDAPRERVAEGRKATPEEVARVVSEAAKLKGGEPERVRSLMRVAGADVVGKAVAWAVKRGKASFRWVESTAPAWKAEGVPDYADETPKETQAEAIMRLFGPGGAYEKPAFDMSHLAGIFTYGDDD